MDETTGLHAFQLFMALKLHFTTSYDFTKYGGKVKTANETSFSTRKDRFHFYKLSRKYTKDELFGFYISNLLKNPKIWAGDLTLEDADQEYRLWQKIQQSLSYSFEQDVQYMLDKVNEPDELLLVIDEQYPILYNLYVQGEINLESIIILNNFMNFFPMWEKKVHDDLLFPDFMKKCRKYEPFLHYDQNKMKNLLKEKLCQHA